MSESEIRVTVLKYPDRDNLVLAYTDPLSGKRKTKSAGTPIETEAWKIAGEWQKQLREGVCIIPSKVSWGTFVDRYTNEKLATLRPRTRDAATQALNRVQRVLGVDKPAKLTSEAMSRFQAKLRADGMKATTLGRHLRHVMAALRWGEKIGLLARAPKVEMPRKAKGSQAKSRGITAEEVDRLLAACPKVRPQDHEEWERFITGVWHSGLRLGEGVALTWHVGPFALDVSGDLPGFVIESEGQKSGKAEVCPVTPDLVTWLRATYPDARERSGRVFHLLNQRTGRPMQSHQVGEIVERIGRKAGVKVGSTSKRDKETGELVELPIFAGCHSLRRGFGSKWARRVSPSILKRLMRHSSITTTEAYYITLNAGDVSGELWAAFGPQAGAGSNKTVNTAPALARNDTREPAEQSTESLANKEVPLSL